MQKSIEEIRAKRNALRDEIVEISGKPRISLSVRIQPSFSKNRLRSKIRATISTVPH